jgi:putative hydrolase of the HAD superfamily
LSIDAVLLDWGHTLFDTPGSVAFITAFGASRGTPIAADEAHALWDDARVRSRSAAEIAKGRDKSPQLHRQCWTSLWTDLEARCPGLTDALYEFETSAAGWSPFVDTAAFLQGLRQRRVPAVIVSDVAFDLRPILRHYGLHDLIHGYVLSGEHGTIKPELRLFQIALDAAGVTPDRALMVGDNHINDGAAIDAGIRTVLLPAATNGQPRGLQLILQLLDATT